MFIAGIVGRGRDLYLYCKTLTHKIDAVKQRREASSRMEKVNKLRT